jgi:hypothetical protein
MTSNKPDGLEVPPDLAGVSNPAGPSSVAPSGAEASSASIASQLGTRDSGSLQAQPAIRLRAKLTGEQITLLVVGTMLALAIVIAAYVLRNSW